jgi:hypothetical protein
MDIGLVKEGALTDHEVPRSKPVVQSERRIGEPLGHFEDKNAQKALSGSDFLRQSRAGPVLIVVILLRGFRNVDVGAVIVKSATKTALSLRTTA